MRSIEHGTLIDEETAAYVAERGAFVVPTLSVMAALLAEGKELGVPQVSLDKLAKVHEGAMRGLEMMRRAGESGLGLGTDLLGEQHRRRGQEFTLRSQVESAFDILHSATAVNAEILQMKDKLGVIKPGAYADLLVVDGDPLSDISLLAAGAQNLLYVMRAGRFVERSDVQS